MKKLRSNWILAGTSILTFFLIPTFAEADAGAGPANLADRFDRIEARISELQNQLTAQNQKHQEEMDSLKRRIEIKGPEEKSVYLPGAAEKGPQWLEGLSMGGDIRLRYEGFNQNEATRDRNRFRYRLRWKVTKQVTDNLELGFRFNTGASNDPTGSNQTFTGDFNFKNIFIDQAYVKYRPMFLQDYIPALSSAAVAGGKFENPFLANSSTMVWDSDVMPEGFYESFEWSLGEGRVKPYAVFGQYILQENAASPDAEVYGFQSGVRWTPPGFEKDSGIQLTHGFAYYDFSDYARGSNFIIDTTSLARGNTRVGSSTALAAGDFDILQVYNALEFKVRELPVKLFGDFAVNLADRTPDPLDRNNAYEYGLKVGNAKKKGDWETGYYYAYVEPNAVVGAFAESDFGAGHADKRGSVTYLRYGLTDFLKLQLKAYFANNITGADDETRRFQTDLEWVF
ncbi:MAG: putative porin [Candidatus Omnitrophica bacterium]|nr:putative porin [Candidatus Omnitrophota bacterium]